MLGFWLELTQRLSEHVGVDALELTRSIEVCVEMDWTLCLS